jgi:arylsulfatase A-like enzyme
MVFAGPGVAPGAIAANASLVDVAPTLLDCAGLPAGAMHGTSLRGLLGGERRAEEERRLAERVLYAHRLGLDQGDIEKKITPGDMWSVQRGPWRLIRNEVTGRTLLYNLDQDRLEQNDLYAAEPERARELEELLDPFTAGGIRAPGEKARVAVDRELFDDLQQMGYVGGDG